MRRYSTLLSFNDLKNSLKSFGSFSSICDPSQTLEMNQAFRDCRIAPVFDVVGVVRLRKHRDLGAVDPEFGDVVGFVAHGCLYLFYSFRKVESNGRGSRSRINSVSVLPERFAIVTGISPQNSQMIWRHVPQGGVSSSVSATTAMALNLVSPS